MRPTLIVQPSEIVPAGSIDEYFRTKNIPSTTVALENGGSLPTVYEIDRIIVLGCPSAVYHHREHDHLKTLFSFMSEAIRRDIPLLGICYGSQMLAHVLGAKVEPNPVREMGVYEVELTDEGRSDPLFDGLDNRFTVFQWHGDTFKIPFGATRLATGEGCKNQAFRKGNAVGVQFHPEAAAEAVRVWCDHDAAQLTEDGKEKESVLTALGRSADDIKRVNFRLLDNFLKS